MTAVDYWVRQARAAIRTAQQANCTHGIPANVCNDCRAETQPTTPRARECETGDNAEEAQQ